eukprot:gene14460-biopygen4243
MSENDTMMEHVNKMRSLAEQMASVGAQVSEEDQVATLLCSLPDSYNNLIVALESRADQLTLEFIIARLLHEERKRSEVSSDLGIAMEKALVTTKEMSRVAGQQVKSTNKKGKCYNCGLKGHWARDCKKPKKSSERPRQQANVTEMEATHTLFWATTSTNKKEANTWIIDSGASQHMSWCKERMVNFREFAVPEKVRLGDNRVVLAQGTGSVWVKVKVEGKWKPVELAEVLFVPDLAKNLLSISAIVKRNLSVVFNEDKCLILNSDGETLGLGRKDRKLFILDCLPMNELAHEANSADDSLQLWHQRFGHLGVKNLKTLQDEELVEGLKFNDSKDMQFCEACVEGKQTRNSFPKGQATHATELLEIVHSDVCGPMQTTSLGGHRYFITFIDDKSRFTAIYFVKNKDEVLQKFKEFEAMATNITGQRIKNLRSDNGGEYSSKEFNDFLTLKGISKQRSVPRTPEQNGVAERMNRTIQETARSMLHAAKLTNDFWGEAVATAVILRNRSPTKAVKDMTPYESFYGIKPDVAHLKVFGCDAYMHIPKELTKKFDSRSRKCIFVGYSLYRKAYRLFDPRTKKLYESRDVVFVENEFRGRIQHQTVETKKIDSTVKPVFKSDEEQLETEYDERVVDLETDENNRNAESQDAEDLQEPRRSNRTRKPPERDGFITGDWWEFEESLNADTLNENTEEPTTIQEALNSSAKVKWKEALDSKYTSLIKNRAWNLVELPKGRKPVGCRWVFKIKHDANGAVERYKARLVAKGYSQEEGIDYEETFSPVARYTSIRSVLAIANQLDLELHQMDVQTAFLNGELEEEIYMLQPEGYKEKGKENFVCKLNKSIYGLKQASRCWFKTMDAYMKNNDYEQCQADSCLYVKRVGAEFIIIALYVDDMLLACSSKQLLQNEKEALQKRFCMKDLGEARYCLGIQIERTLDWGIQFDGSKEEGVQLSGFVDADWGGNVNGRKSQSGYMFTICGGVVSWASKKQTSVALSSTEAEYVAACLATKEAVWLRSLLADLNFTQEEPTVVQEDNQGAIAMSKNPKFHARTKHIDIKHHFIREKVENGTLDWGIQFDGSKEEGVQLSGFVDADWGGNVNGRKSQSGYMFTICGGVVSWASKKQTSVALSSTEAEYVAACLATKEAVWLRSLLADLNFTQEEPTVVQEDNQGAIAMSKNPKFHARTKHIDIKHHFIREKVENVICPVYACEIYVTTDNKDALVEAMLLERWHFTIGTEPNKALVE